MPVSIANLKTEIEKVIREKIKDFSIEKLTPTDLVIASSRAPGLAFRKALRLNTTNDETQKKHYEAQYELSIMWSAFDFYEKTQNSDLLSAIYVQLRSFNANGLIPILTEEEKESYRDLFVQVWTLMNPEGSEE